MRLETQIFTFALCIIAAILFMFLEAMNEIDDINQRLDRAEGFDAHCEWAIETVKGCKRVEGFKGELQKEETVPERL